MENNKRPTRLGRPQKDQARNTRQCILDVSLELFATQGFAGTSLRQIARGVGIKESAIYAHFASKEALYRALFEQVVVPVALVQELFGANRSALEQRDPATVLREVAQRIIELWNEPHVRLFLCLLLQESMSGKVAGNALLLPAIERVQEELGPLVQHWIEQGLVRQDFPAEHLIWELLAPLANIRLLYWNAQATEAKRELGQRRAALHIEYFLRTALTPKTGEG